jgi:protein TonB
MAATLWADPVADVLGRLHCDRRWFGAMFVAAACTHAAVAWALQQAPSHPLPPRAPIQVVDIDIPPIVPPPEAPATAPEPPKAESVRPTAPRAVHAAPQAAPPAPAAAVITRPADDSEPLDLGGFVLGSTSTYAGGATVADGAPTTAIAGGSTGPGATAPARPSPSIERGPDRSRRPAVAGGLEWRCPFPSEADAEGIDEAVATIRIDVDAGGAVRGVSIQSDPGHGFGREARRCALTKAWTPALDREGKPVDGTAVVKVRFIR